MDSKYDDLGGYMSEMSSLDQNLDEQLAKDPGMNPEQVAENFHNESRCYNPIDGEVYGSVPTSQEPPESYAEFNSRFERSDKFILIARKPT